MKFNTVLRRQYFLLEKEPPKDAALPQDDAAGGESQSAIPPAGEGAGASAAAPNQVMPEGYVDLVRLLAKALVMNIPVGTIDDLFSTPVTNENAGEVRDKLEKVINLNENFEDNPERIGAPGVKSFVANINEHNFQKALDKIRNIMKQYSRDPSLG